MRRLFNETRSWATVLFLNNSNGCFKHALQGLDWHAGTTINLWPASQLYTYLGQFGNYTVYHYTHLVSKPPTIFLFCLFTRQQLPVQST